MRKFIVVLSPLLAFAFISCAQQYVSSVDTKLQQQLFTLKKSGVNFSITYQVDCIGYVRPYKPDSCYINDIKYLFWKYKGDNFIQRFDNCYNYPPTVLNEKFVDEVSNNLTEIKQAQIKYPQYIITKRNKKDTVNVVIDHSCHYIFSILSGTEKVVKDIDDFALDTKELDDYSGDLKSGPTKRHNENYEKNQLSILTKLKNMAEQITNALNKKGSR